jgi:hypothetical protein
MTNDTIVPIDRFDRTPTRQERELGHYWVTRILDMLGQTRARPLDDAQIGGTRTDGETDDRY